MAQYILATVLGLMMATIAFLQWRTNHHKLKLELFDRRYKVYLSIIELFAVVARKNDLNSNDIDQFVRDSASYDFLFKEEVHRFMERLEEVGVELAMTSDPKEKQKLRPWFREQNIIVPDLFKPYLDFSKL